MLLSFYIEDYTNFTRHTILAIIVSPACFFCSLFCSLFRWSRRVSPSFHYSSKSSSKEEVIVVGVRFFLLRFSQLKSSIDIIFIDMGVFLVGWD